MELLPMAMPPAIGGSAPCPAWGHHQQQQGPEQAAAAGTVPVPAAAPRSVVASHHFKTAIVDHSGLSPPPFCTCCARPSAECNQYANWFTKGARVLDIVPRADGSGGARVHILGADGRLALWHVPDNTLTVLPMDPVHLDYCGVLHPAYCTGVQRATQLRHSSNARWIVLMASGALRVADFGRPNPV